MILLGTAILPCLVVVGLGIFHMYYYRTRTRNEEVRSAIYFVILMPPVTVAGAIVGMCIPRAAGFLYAVTTTYYMLALYMIVDLMFTMFCGRRALSRYLREKSMNVKLKKPSFVKFLKCIPDRELRPSIFFTATNIITVVSMNVSQYFGHALVDTVKELLESYGFGLLFDLQDLIISAPTLQKMVLDIAVAFGLIKPLNLIPDSSLSMFYLNVLMIWQCLLVSLYATYAFQPSKAELFDAASIDDLILRKNTPDRKRVRLGNLEWSQEGTWRDADDD